jgi:hypothetical protein
MKASPEDVDVKIFDDAEHEIHNLLVVNACARYVQTAAYKKLTT